MLPENDQGEEAALEVGYSGVQPEQAAPQQTAEQPEPKTVETPKADGEPEPKVPADPESEALKLAKTLDGRYRNLTGDLNKISARLEELATSMKPADAAAATAAAKAEGIETPTQQQVTAALKNGAKMKALREDFPDWADAIDEAVTGGMSQLEQSILAKVKPEKVDTSGFATVDSVTKIGFAAISAHHKTWKKDVVTPEFSQWLEAQPDDVRALAGSDDPEDAIAMMDKFYASRPSKDEPPTKPDPKQRLAGAVMPNSGATKPPPKVITEDDALAIGYQTAI